MTDDIQQAWPPTPVAARSPRRLILSIIRTPATTVHLKMSGHIEINYTSIGPEVLTIISHMTGEIDLYEFPAFAIATTRPAHSAYTPRVPTALVEINSSPQLF
jgi:hypothetical protein